MYELGFIHSAACSLVVLRCWITVVGVLDTVFHNILIYILY